MSEIFEDEEIKDRKPINDGYTYYLEFGKAIAKAQRDSSDREWINLIKETANIGHGVVYFAIPIEQWQAINEKAEVKNDRPL